MKHPLTQFSKALEFKQAAKEYHKIAVKGRGVSPGHETQQYIYQYLDQAVSYQLEEIKLHC